MKRTIKQEVMLRVALMFLVVILSGAATTLSMRQIRIDSKRQVQAVEIQTLVLSAEKAHYGWVENLSSAISMGTEFTGSKDYKGCVLGKWFYSSDLSGVDKEILELIEKMKPIHQAIHESAQTVLDLNETSPEQAKETYLNTTKANVDSLVALLDEVEAIADKQVKDIQVE